MNKFLNYKLPKIYNAQSIEDAIYQTWETSRFFNPDNIIKIKKSLQYGGQAKLKIKKFSIAMPPPNATGELHLGHAVMLALEDIMIRYHRMRGEMSLWLPGTDHAAIATQNKVERLLQEKGISRHNLGREKFLKEVEKFVKESQSIIQNQVRKMGASSDWSRKRYTLDKNLTKAVQMVFVKMYKAGLIYRGNRIVNWCPRCGSTLADDEVEYKTIKGKFYYFKYGPITIGTARPETKFLDKTIIVHPKDKRYKHLIGQKLIVPWIEGEVEANVIADPIVDMNFGSGAMTLTPAHSFVDFDLAQKYGLPIIQIIDENGNLTKAAGEFCGMNGYHAREAIVKKMKDKNLVEKIDENYEHNLSFCYRCNTAVEPLISTQWFINVNSKFKIKSAELRKISGKKETSLKEMAIETVKKGEIKIIPARFNKVYFHWMENLRDWCISRQIWFGHRIPIWYCDNKTQDLCNTIIASIDKPRICRGCRGVKLRQDSDVLDTWFSSSLWTFSTLLDRKIKKGETFEQWRRRSKDLLRFHPTSVLETGYDILFFWVARMILMTTFVLEEVPFRTVYLHGLVRDKYGRKMSKSLGNGINPLDMIKKYGADAVRLSLVIGTTPGNDVRLYEEKIAGYRNFVNKVWNIARYILLNSKFKARNSKQTQNSKFPPILLAGKIQNFSLADHWILFELAGLVKRVNRNLEHYRFSAAGEDIYEFMRHKLADIYIEEIKQQKLEHQQEILEYILEKCLIILHPFIPFVTETIFQKFKNSNLKIQNSLLMIQPWVKKLDFTISKARALEFIKARETKKQQALSEAEKRELKSYIASLKARLSNKEFLAKAPKEVVEKEKARLKEAVKNLI